jgi:thiamine-monophosphate kinase
MDRGIGEFELIDRLASVSDSRPPLTTGIGDDASVAVHAGQTATSVDAIVEGVHFRREWSSPLQIAIKATGTALSDIAAMAADPGEVYVTLGVPADTPRAFLEALADGFAEAAAGFGVCLAGGDTVASPVMFISVTAVGRAPAGEPLILRSGAAVGDLVAVTGEFGGARAGLFLLESGGPEGKGAPPAGAMSTALRRGLESRQLEPRPQLEAGSALRGSGANSLVDVSDGLAADLGHVARASGVAIEIDCGRVPVQAGVAEVAETAGLEAIDLALSGGEDYELAFTLPAVAFERVEGLFAPLGCGLTVIGEVRSGSGVQLVTDGRREQPPAGFDHFA